MLGPVDKDSLTRDLRIMSDCLQVIVKRFTSDTTCVRSLVLLIETMANVRDIVIDKSDKTPYT